MRDNKPSIKPIIRALLHLVRFALPLPPEVPTLQAKCTFQPASTVVLQRRHVDVKQGQAAQDARREARVISGALLPT